MFTSRGATRHLDIDQAAGVQPVTRHDFPDDAGEGGTADRPGNAQRVEGPVKPVQVLVLVGEAATMEVDNLVDAVAERPEGSA